MAKDQGRRVAAEKMAEPILTLTSVSKTFSGVQVLKDISVEIGHGKVTALLGHNGSGKSTLVKILAGFHSPDPGAAIRLRDVDLSLPVVSKVAHALGLRFVHQNPALVEELTVADNIALSQGFDRRAGNPTVSRHRHRLQAQAAMEKLEVDVPVDRPVGDLTSTQRMLVAIARAVDIAGHADGALIVLDEPTAYLPADSVGQIHRIIDRIRGEGGSVIYVTHRIDEVKAIADQLVVLRDGALVEDRPAAGLGEDEIAQLIVGSTQSSSPAPLHEVGTEVKLACRGLSGRTLRDISIEVRSGEIMGIAGLIGCGRSELIRIITGVQAPRAGEMALSGRSYRPRDPRDALGRGVAYVPPDRANMGVIKGFSLRDNVTVGRLSAFWKGGHLDTTAETSEVMGLVRQFGIRPSRPEQAIEQFSGGNQQKAVLAKLIRLSPSLLVLDEPTQGVDVRGKEEIAQLLGEFASAGNSVIVGSSDFEEVAKICDQVVVLDRGVAKGIFTSEAMDEQKVALLAASRNIEPEAADHV